MAKKTSTKLGTIPEFVNEVEQNPIAEARRYIKNAKDILKKYGNKGAILEGYYQDPKYVKMAGNTAWNGVLVAMEAVFELKTTMKKGQRAGYYDYLKKIAKTNYKILTLFESAYDTLHKSMGYDGQLSVKIATAAIEAASSVIDWCESKYSE